MGARRCRFVLAGFFAGLLSVSAHPGDILLNSDFTDGKTHWQGGGQAPTNMGGKLIVNLDPKKWTVIYQHFSTRTSVLNLTIVYSLSRDCSLIPRNQRPEDQTRLFTSGDLVDACGLHDDFDDWKVYSGAIGIAFTVCSGNIMARDTIEPTATPRNGAPGPDPTGRRTYSATLSRDWGPFDNDEFCLAFPPGEGTVNLVQVTLTKIGN